MSSKPTFTETHRGASHGQLRVSTLEASGALLTVEQVTDFLQRLPEGAPVVVEYRYADDLGKFGTTRISAEWVQGWEPR